MESKKHYWRPGRAAYNDFIESEGVPIIDEYYVDDVADVKVGDWKRTGGRGAILSLPGHGGFNDVHIHEIPPGESLNPQSHMFEEIIYVAEGRGATVLETADGEDVTFEWKEDSLFAIPRKMTHRHINIDDKQRTLLVSNTDLPTVFSLFNEEEIFEAEFTRSGSDGGFDVNEGTLYEVPGVPVVWEANFVPDASRFDKLDAYDQRGAGGTSAKFSFPDVRLRAHMSEFPVGTYKKAHRHRPGANLLILDGEGYTLMWSSKNPDEKVRVDWESGTLATPPTLWYHQHFNLGNEPARYLALHPPDVAPIGPDNWFVPSTDDNQIEYVEEDVEIRETYKEELEKRGLEFRMSDECYERVIDDFEMEYEPVE